MGRGGRARLWIRWALRDARRRWLQIASIALLLALGIGMYASMGSMERWRVDSADASLAALRMHDLRVALADGSFAAAGTLERAVAGIPSRRAVAAAAERLVVPTQVDASRGGRSIIVPGRIVGSAVTAPVDRLKTGPGRGLRPGEDGRPVAVLERNFAKHYGLPSSGSVRIAGGRVVRYAGQGLGPEYFIVTAPGADFGAEASFAVLFTGLKSAQLLAGQPGRVNQVVVRLAPGADADAIAAQIRRALRQALPATGVTITPRAAEPSIRVLYKDAEGDQRMFNVFAALILGAAVFAAFNLVSRTVEAQRREIGIGMALGVAPRTLARRPVLLGVQVAALGVALGIPVGLVAALWLRGILNSFFLLPELRTGLEASTFARAATLGIALPLAATALPVWRALRVTPIEAIRVGARAARSSGLAWLAAGVRLPGGTLANLPLRNVLRTPRRTATTALGIGAVVTIVVALAGLLDSFDRTIDASRREALAGNAARMTVDLAAPQPVGGPLAAAVAAAPAVGRAEPSLRLPATLAAAGERIDAFLEVVPGRGTLWRPTLADGSLPARRPGIAIARRAADDLGIGIGDTVAVRHAVPAGPRSFRLVTTRLPVTGINTSPFRFVAYATPASAAPLGVAGLASRISVVPAPGRGAEDVRRALLRLPAVTAVQGAAAITDAVDDRMAQFTDVLVVTVAIAMAMALLIAFNTTAINADERARENATMFASGLPVRRVVAGSIAEGTIVGVLATAAGIAAGYGVLRWVVRTTMPETLPYLGTLIAISPATCLLAVLAGTVVVGLAPLLMARRLRRTDIPSTLRVVE